LGLVVAELVTNSFDHAFPNHKGSANVSVRRTADDPDTATIIIRDSGSGFKAGAEAKRHGIGLVRRLVQQIRGTAFVESDRGTVWTINFPTANVVAGR
jgi:two-component sensor histidine kinase